MLTATLLIAASAFAADDDAQTDPGFLATLKTPPAEAQLDDLNVVNFGGDLVPFVGTSAVEPERTVRHLSLNLIGGYTYGISGAEGSAGFNVETGFVHGVQGAGGANVNLGVLRGAQGAGGFNYAGIVDGVQGSGGFNVSRTSVRGVQATGGFNLAGEAVDGVQAAGGFNVAREVRGGQGAGGANIAVGDLRGVQGAGGVNVVVGDVRGVQAAGGVNVATGEVQGVQLGTLNVALEEARVQVGVVNVAPNADVALGLLNIMWEGRNHVDVWADSQGFMYAGYKGGSRYVHNMYSVGVQTIGGEQTWSYGLGIGGHIPMAKRAAIDLDIMTHQINEGVRWCNYVNLLNQARAVLVLSPFENLGIYAGPTYDVRIQDSAQRFTVEGRPGVTAGIQLF